MRVFVVVACVGCNQLLGVQPTKLRGPDAAIDAVGCSGVTFVGPTLLAGFDSGYDGQWGPLELWFDSFGSSAGWELYHATRTSPDVPFDVGTKTNAVELNSPVEDNDPAVTLDGLDMVFTSLRNNATYLQAWEATRSDPGQAFGTVHLIAEASDKAMDGGHDLSWDGRWLFYANGAGDLRALYRPTRADPFGPASAVIATGVTWPSISPDLLELFYVPAGGSGVYRRTRTDVNGSFDSTPELIAATGDDPDISNDSTVLVMDISGQLQVMTRVCP